MKILRNIRILLAVVMIFAAVLYAFVPGVSHPLSRLEPHTQIVPSMLSATIGATLFWLVVSFMFGRAYCASFCPVGIMQDAVIGVRLRFAPPQWRYRRPVRWRWGVLAVYVAALLLGIGIIPALLEPWNIFIEVAAPVNPTPMQEEGLRLIVGATAGIIGAATVLLAILVWAWAGGRRFCNVMCPIGTVLGAARVPATFHIELDPDRCISCLKCEDVCRGRCISITERHIDAEACVLCFDCLDVCPNSALRYTSTRNRPTTPLGQQS